MGACFTYKKTAYDAQLIIFSQEDMTAEDYVDLKSHLSKFDTLFLSQKHHAHPFGHKESKEELEARVHFNMEQWILVAGSFTNRGLTGYESAMIVNRANPRHAFIVDMVGLQVKESIFDSWEIDAEDIGVLSMDEVLEAFDCCKKKIVNVKKEEPVERSIEVISPSFTPNKKRAIPTLQNEHRSPKPYEKKPYPKTPAPKPEFVPAPDEEEQEQEDITPIVPSFTPLAFEARSSKKPKKIQGFVGQKKPIIPQKEEEIDAESEEKEIIDVPVSPSFAPVSNRKPRNLDAGRSLWNQKTTISYKADTSYPNGRIVLASLDDEKTLAMFAVARERISGFSSLRIQDNCAFAPAVPPGDFALRKHLRNFDIKQWNILSINIDSMNQPVSALLSFKQEPTYCLVVTMAGLVGAISFQGIAVVEPFATFSQLLLRIIPPREKKRSEENRPKPVVAPKAPAKAPLAVKAKEEKPKLTAHRRVFVTNAFLKAEDRFVSKYHAQAREDFEGTITSILSLDDEGLENYLRAHDAKPIREQGGLSIYKFRFGTSREYEAARLFYCRGYDFKRKMNSSDFLLLGLSDQGEHEEQNEISAIFAKMLNPDSDPVLYQKLLPVEKDGSIDELAYMSSKQFSYLDNARSQMPMAFLGSAGTGKTLLSLQHYLSLLEEGKKVLYLTYQKALCDEVRKKLHELGAKDVDALTYRDLCNMIFGEEVGKEMRTKRRFRRWFLNYVDRTGTMQKRLRAVGPTAEDQFMACYVFYRGIIDGAKTDWQRRRGRILSRSQFMHEVRAEQGFSQAAFDAVYDVALAYEKHLEDRHGTTDNKLAYRILSLGKSLQRYDAVVIDEFQDLSEIQFMAIISLLKPVKPLPLFIYGDENQAINPTIFGFADANNILFDLFGEGVRFSAQELNDSFRSGPNLVHYINDVNKVKRKAIGARRLEEETEVSLREDEEDLFATLMEGEERLGALIKVCAETSKEVVFIFPSVLRKEEAAQKYASIAKVFVESSFLSVEEAKGREWDSVVLVDFFTSSRDMFDAMLGEERVGHHSTVHRMLFNRFYVALTRARNRIVVYESNVSDLIRKELLSGLTPLSDTASLTDYFQGEAEDTAWEEFGEKLMAGKKYAAAYKAFSRGEGERATQLASLAYQYLQAERDELSSAEAIELYLGQLDYANLMDLYEEQGLIDKKAFLAAAMEEDVDPDYLYEAYRAIEDTLSEEEKNVFFCLATQAYVMKLNALFDKMED